MNTHLCRLFHVLFICLLVYTNMFITSLIILANKLTLPCPCYIPHREYPYCQSPSLLVNWTYRAGKPMQYITSAYADKSWIIKPAKIAHTDETILTKHKNINKEIKLTNSQIIGFSRSALPTLKIFSLGMPTLDTK